MHIISAEEWQLLSFFEVEPTPADKGIAWPYNEYLYEIVRGDFELSCTIDPAYRDVRMVLTFRGDKIYELESTNIQDIRYSNERGAESLEIVLSPAQSIRLVVKPTIELTHKVQAED